MDCLYNTFSTLSCHSHFVIRIEAAESIRLRMMSALPREERTRQMV